MREATISRFFLPAQPVSTRKTTPTHPHTMSAGPEEGAGAGACVLGRAWVPTVTHVFVWAGAEGGVLSLLPFVRGGVCAAVVVGVLASLFFCFWSESAFSPK